MQVFPAIKNGLEFLNITSPDFKKTTLNKLLKETKDAYYFIDGYASNVFLDRLDNAALKDRFVLSSYNLTYFTSTNIRERFNDVLGTIEKIGGCFMVHDIPLFRNMDIDDKKIEKLCKTIGDLSKNVESSGGSVAISIPSTELHQKFKVYLNAINENVKKTPRTFILNECDNVEVLDSLFGILVKDNHSESMAAIDALFGSSTDSDGGFNSEKTKVFIPYDVNFKESRKIIFDKYQFKGKLYCYKNCDGMEDYQNFLNDISK